MRLVVVFQESSHVAAAYDDADYFPVLCRLSLPRYGRDNADLASYNGLMDVRN
jgi:hypothetical protein